MSALMGAKTSLLGVILPIAFTVCELLHNVEGRKTQGYTNNDSVKHSSASASNTSSHPKNHLPERAGKLHGGIIAVVLLGCVVVLIILGLFIIMWLLRSLKSSPSDIKYDSNMDDSVGSLDFLDRVITRQKSKPVGAKRQSKCLTEHTVTESTV